MGLVVPRSNREEDVAFPLHRTWKKSKSKISYEMQNSQVAASFSTAEGAGVASATEKT